MMSKNESLLEFIQERARVLLGLDFTRFLRLGNKFDQLCAESYSSTFNSMENMEAIEVKTSLEGYYRKQEKPKESWGKR